MIRNCKRQRLVDKYFEVIKEYEPINTRLFQAVDEGKIKSGALLVYLSWETHGHREINKALGKSMRPESKVRMKDVLSVWHWEYYINDILKYKAEAERFLEEHGA